MSDDRRKTVWEALSEVFVDNDTDYDRIAELVGDINPEALQEIFFTEVAPHCGPNLMSAVPPFWAGFDRQALARGIREMQARNRDSLIARLRHKAFVHYLRLHFRTEWQAIRAALAKRRA